MLWIWSGALEETSARCCVLSSNPALLRHVTITSEVFRKSSQFVVVTIQCSDCSTTPMWLFLVRASNSNECVKGLPDAPLRSCDVTENRICIYYSRGAGAIKVLSALATLLLGLSRFYGVPFGFVPLPPFLWVLVCLQSPEGGCFSISDDLSCSWNLKVA